jgi:hypothetical protein
LASPRTFTVDVSSIIAATNFIDGYTNTALVELSTILRGTAQNLLHAIFSDAVKYADSEGGFPPPFQDHVMSVLGTIPILSNVHNGAVSITIDFDYLGTNDELKRAYHQGARLADGSILWGPYEGQELARKDKSGERSHLAWQSLRAGFSGVKFGSKSKTFNFPSGSSWEATMQQYISIWGNKAPEWKYIEYGQQKWDPKIPASAVLEDFDHLLQIEGTRVFEELLARIMETANGYSELGVPVVPTAAGPGRKFLSFREVSTGQYISPNPGNYIG